MTDGFETSLGVHERRVSPRRVVSNRRLGADRRDLPRRARLALVAIERRSGGDRRGLERRAGERRVLRDRRALAATGPV